MRMDINHLKLCLQQIIGVNIRTVMCCRETVTGEVFNFWSIVHLLHSSFEEFYIFDYVSNTHYYLMAVGNASSIT